MGPPVQAVWTWWARALRAMAAPGARTVAVRTLGEHPTTAGRIDEVQAADGRRRRTWRWLRRAVVLVLVALLLPVPWQHRADSSLGLVWRLDRRLHLGGEALDPPGHYSWLTVGRPALVAELLWERVAMARDPGARSIARDIRRGSVSSRPAHTEGVAAAVGMRRAGHDVVLTVRVTVSVPEPGHAGLPQRAVITRIDDLPISDRDALRHALTAAAPREELAFETAAGERHVVAGGELPYQHMEVVDLAPDITATVGGQGPPYSWIRSMSMGSSHGLMVGLTTYAALADEDLAAGRHIAGTGRLFGDGTVGSIGGLKAKAGAARRSGADVLLFPASQAHLLANFEPGRMRLVPVESIDEAITELRRATP